MREIKFRAWDCVNKEMVAEDSERHCFVMDDGVPELLVYYDEEDGFIKCTHAMMQYTGLKDKNGVEIYEGDIVKAFSVFDMTYDYSFEKDNDPEASYQISFCDGCFQFKGVKQWSDGSNDWRSIENVELFKVEVIGNIYENPELLSC